MSRTYQGPIISRTDAGAAGLAYYFTGKPCRRGHIAQRYVSSFGCLVCSDLNVAKWRSDNPQKVLDSAHTYRTRHPEKAAAAAKKWRKEHPEKIKEFNIRSYEKNGEQYRLRAYRAALARQEKKAGRPKPTSCEICHTTAKPNDRKTRIVFDHCHQRGTFRGWICHRCNIALGHADDSILRLEQLITYLRKHEIRCPAEESNSGLSLTRGLFSPLN